MGSSKKTMINLVCSMMVLLTNIVINFWLSPYIVENIGVEANGFVTLANNFVTYAQLMVTALNSMAARFIAISYVKKDYKKANLYYNSVFWGKLIIIAILIVPSIILIAKLENFVNLPSDIALDVKLLFSFVFFNFFITTGMPNWECGTFVTNRLDRSYIPQMISSIVRCGFLFIIFMIVTPKVFYVGISATIMTVITLMANCYNTNKLTPELKIGFFGEKRQCSKSAIKELIGSGIWNTVSSVGSMLLSGLDLIICNLMIGATEMGIVALCKVVPHQIEQLSLSIRNAFAPQLVINYANGNKDEVYRDITQSMKITNCILTIPLAGVFAVGDKFFELWVPTQNANTLHILSCLCLMGYTFTSGVQILYNVFTTVNKVKQNAIPVIISGAVSTLVVFILLKTTNLGMYAICGVSPVVCLIRNLGYVLPKASVLIGFKWHTFFPNILQSVLSTGLIFAVAMLAKHYWVFGSWTSLIIYALAVGMAGLIINILLIFNKNERKAVIGKIKRKLKKC